MVTMRVWLGELRTFLKCGWLGLSAGTVLCASAVCPLRQSHVRPCAGGRHMRIATEGAAVERKVCSPCEAH